MKRNEAIDLLGKYLSILPPRWQGLQTYIAIYITLVSGIFSLLIANLGSVGHLRGNVGITFGVFAILLLSQFAKITIRKQNEHIKELIVLIAKLELEIGLYDLKGKAHPKIKLWEEDEYFLTPKWVNQRLESGKSSTAFIKEFQESSAKFAYYIFLAFQAISVVFFVVVFFYLFHSNNKIF